jgi:hypothetical protein
MCELNSAIDTFLPLQTIKNWSVGGFLLRNTPLTDQSTMDDKVN